MIESILRVLEWLANAVLRAIGYLIYYWDGIIFCLIVLVGVGWIWMDRVEIFLWINAPKKEWIKRIKRGTKNGLQWVHAHPWGAAALVLGFIIVNFMNLGVAGWLPFEFPEWLKVLWLAIAD